MGTCAVRVGNERREPIIPMPAKIRLWLFCGFVAQRNATPLVVLNSPGAIHPPNRFALAVLERAAVGRSPFVECRGRARAVAQARRLASMDTVGSFESLS